MTLLPDLCCFLYEDTKVDISLTCWVHEIVDAEFTFWVATDIPYGFYKLKLFIFVCSKDAQVSSSLHRKSKGETK